jgi:hypothetical protein
LKNSLEFFYPMEIIEKLPDDIVLYIYTKILKRFRFYKGELIKLIDVDKYSFLEKYVFRRAVSICKSYNTYSADVTGIDVNEKKYRIQYSIPNICEIVNRKELYIDDDMICMELIENDNDNSLHYEISKFRLKRIENINNKKLPTIYHRGKLADYDWDVIHYSYNI